MEKNLLHTVSVVRADVTSRGLREIARGSSSSVMRKTRFVADFGALLSALINVAQGGSRN